MNFELMLLVLSIFFVGFFLGAIPWKKDFKNMGRLYSKEVQKVFELKARLSEKERECDALKEEYFRKGYEAGLEDRNAV